VIPYLTIALAVCSLFATAYMNFVRPARRRRRAAAEIAPREPRPNFAPNRPTGPTPPGGRLPLDTSRPYPRPKGNRSKLNKVCPVCGTGDETTALDGRVLGWRAHASCAEWLGDWKPKVPVSGGGYAAEPSGDPGPIPVGPVLRRGTGSTSTIHYNGSTASASGGAGGSGATAIQFGSFPIASTGDLVLAQEMMMRGMASIDEARERLGREVIASFGVPGPSFGADVIEQRRKPPGVPVMHLDCTCGRRYIGTADWITESIYAHRTAGRCRR